MTTNPGPYAPADFLQEIRALFGFDVKHLQPNSILGRYRDAIIDASASPEIAKLERVYTNNLADLRIAIQRLAAKLAYRHILSGCDRIKASTMKDWRAAIYDAGQTIPSG